MSTPLKCAGSAGSKGFSGSSIRPATKLKRLSEICEHFALKSARPEKYELPLKAPETLRMETAASKLSFFESNALNENEKVEKKTISETMSGIRLGKSSPIGPRKPACEKILRIKKPLSCRAG